MLNVVARLSALFVFVVVIGFGSTPASAFTETFEMGLGAWTGKMEGGTSGQIIPDPLEADSALNFSLLATGGDIFSIETFPAGTYKLSFDYLGDPNAGGVANNLGGFIGISEGFAPDGSLGFRWLQATAAFFGAEAADLIDDGQWHHYSVTFTTEFSFHIVAEDFISSSGVAGDAYFDNITLLPAPSPVPMLNKYYLVALFVLLAGAATLQLHSSRRPFSISS